MYVEATGFHERSSAAGKLRSIQAIEHKDRYDGNHGDGRSERIRTSDPLNPIQVRYQAALRSDWTLTRR